MRFLITFVCWIYLPWILVAQENSRCATDEHYQSLLQENPELVKGVSQSLNDIRTRLGAYGKVSSDTVRIIPVVVHMIHDNGWEKIDIDQIEDGIRKLNEDFRMAGPDTVITRDVFKSFAVDSKFEFRLAQIDPDGNCTNGVTYWESLLTYHTYDSVKSLVQWPQEKYFNIWIVNTISARKFNLMGFTIAGYEQFPWIMGINETYGAVVKHDYWGDIGTGINHQSRTESHEVGHCLGLFHLWQDQSGGSDGCSITVGNDCTDNNDLVCDTPPMQFIGLSCDSLQNTCDKDTIGPSPYLTDTFDMIENFMTYDPCQSMFTVGQKARMDAVIQNYTELLNLTSYANNVATGTDSDFVASPCKPVAVVQTSSRRVCEGSSLVFYDEAWNGQPSSWLWSFPGGSPSASTLDSPMVTYNTAGKYDVQLVVSNTGGADTITLTDYITVRSVNADYTGSSFNEDFEDSLVLDSMWSFPLTGLNHGWQPTDSVAYTGSYSVMVDNLGKGWPKELIEFITPSYDISQISDPRLSFKYAFSHVDAWSEDVLRVYESMNCGETWVPRATLIGSTIQTVSDQTTPFYPGGQVDWNEKEMFVTATSPNIMFKFSFMSFWGNNIFIDDINIYEKPIGLKEINSSWLKYAYPNPSTDETRIEYNVVSGTSKAYLVLYSMQGVEVKRLELAPAHGFIMVENGTLITGTYFYRLETDKEITRSHKLVIIH